MNQAYMQAFRARCEVRGFDPDIVTKFAQEIAAAQPGPEVPSTWRVGQHPLNVELPAYEQAALNSAPPEIHTHTTRSPAVAESQSSITGQPYLDTSVPPAAPTVNPPATAASAPAGKATTTVKGVITPPAETPPATEDNTGGGFGFQAMQRPTTNSPARMTPVAQYAAMQERAREFAHRTSKITPMSGSRRQ